jgi:hypothetical protein
MRVEPPKWIALERILWLREDGTEVEISANVGEPYQVDKELWACPVSLDGVFGRCGDIYGSSSLQSLCLAIGLLASQLRHLVETNSNLVYLSDRTCKWNLESLNAIFGSSGSSS